MLSSLVSDDIRDNLVARITTSLHQQLASGLLIPYLTILLVSFIVFVALTAERLVDQHRRTASEHNSFDTIDLIDIMADTVPDTPTPKKLFKAAKSSTPAKKKPATPSAPATPDVKKPETLNPAKSAQSATKSVFNSLST